MKLILSRREEEEVRKMTAFSMIGALSPIASVHYLDVTLETTPEEMMLIEKQRLDRMPMCTGSIKSVISSSGEEIQSKATLFGGVEIRVAIFAGESTQLSFETIDHLIHVENQIIENARKLKGMLANGTFFKAEAPREIEL